MLTRIPLAALVALAATLVPFATIPAHAQKPALTENIDEKGRVPYYDAAQGYCLNGECVLIFKTVPAGYRLVITYATGVYQAPSSPSVNNFNLVTLSSGASGQGNNSSVPYTAYLTPTTAGANVYTFSNPLTFYAEPNSTPQMVISNVSSVSGEQSGVISGYLVSIP
jgi:hypothetical protein